MAWLMFGDFNETMYSKEMKGRRTRREVQMRAFREALADYELSDLGWQGYPFTFSNKRKGIHETRARLDRAVENKEWMAMFPKAKVTHGFANMSDHNPIILSLIEIDRIRSAASQTVFKFKPMWLRDKNFKQIVEQT